MKSKTLTTTNINSGNVEKLETKMTINGIETVPKSINFLNNTGGVIGIIFLSSQEEEDLFDAEIAGSGLASFGYLSVPNGEWLNQVNICKIFKLALVKVSGVASTQANINLYHYSERL